MEQEKKEKLTKMEIDWILYDDLHTYLYLLQKTNLTI